MRQLDPGTMLDAVSAAVVLADDQGRVIRMNSYAHKVFRGRPTELREVGLESQAGEQTVRRMDGSSVTASVAVTVIDDGLSVLTVSEWDGHNEYARLDLNAFGVGTWDWHIPSGDLHFDRRWLEMLGYQQGELDYDLEAWERLVHPDDRDRVDEELRAHLAGRTPTYRCEYRCRHRDGHYVWVLDTGTVIERDATGRPLRASGIHLDITDRKRQDVEREELIAELERTRDRLKDLVRIDELTGLGNRRVLAEAMDRAWLGQADPGITSNAVSSLSTASCSLLVRPSRSHIRLVGFMSSPPVGCCFVGCLSAGCADFDTCRPASAAHGQRAAGGPWLRSPEADRQRGARARRCRGSM